MTKLGRREFVALPLAAAAASGAAKAMRLGVIAEGKDPESAIRRVSDLGFPTCQVVFGTADEALAKRLRTALDRYKIEATALVVTGPAPEVYDFIKGPLTIGLVPREYRAARLARFKQGSDFAKMAGIPGVQGHCGFIPENPNDPLFGEAVAAIREVAAHCKKNGLTFRCETGQETPVTLLRAIRRTGLENVGVNFDAANLILYGKANPVDALDTLGPLVMGVHAKDGLYPTNGDQLGEEVAIGKGKVNFPRLIEKLKAIGYQGPLTIEREISGPKQEEDIRASKAYLEKLVG